MATAPITRPFLSQNLFGHVGLTRAPLSNGSNTFVQQQFVKVSAGILAAYVADDTGIYGLTPDPSHTTTAEAYSAPYGQIHNVIDPRGATFVMNLTDGSGTVGSGTTTQGDATIGTLYSARYLASVDTSAVAVDLSDSGTSTKHIFRVDGLWPQDATTDFNGRVIVSILGTGIQ